MNFIFIMDKLIVILVLMVIEIVGLCLVVVCIILFMVFLCVVLEKKNICGEILILLFVIFN